MKHLFLVHSPITYLTSVSVINTLDLNEDNAVIIFFEFEKIKSANKNYTAVSINDFYPNKVSLKKIYYYFRYFNVIKRFDKLVNSVTDNNKFTAYIPVLLFAGKAIITNPNCVAFSFIEEGLLNYYTEETLKSLTVIKSKNPWRSSVFKNTKLVISEMYEVLRGYNFKLQALPFSYSCYHAFENVLYYGLSRNSFPLTNAEKRVIAEFKKESFSNIEQSASYDLNNSVIWIGDGGVTQHGLNESVYLKGIEYGCIPFIKQHEHKNCFIKFHRDEKTTLREAVKNLFTKHNIQFEIIPDSIVMELLLFNTTNATLIGVYSSLLYYASIMNHSAFSIFNFLKSEYAQIIADRDFTFFLEQSAINRNKQRSTCITLRSMAKLKTARNVALYTTGEIIPRVLSFLLLPILTKYLSTSDYGISSYINTVLTFLYALTTLSVNSYALRTFYKIDSDFGRKKLIGNVFVFLCGWGMIMLVLEALLFPVLLNTFSVKVPFYPYFLLGLIINFFDVASIIPLITYRVNEDAKGFVLLSVGRTILQYVFILLFIIYFKMGLLGSFLGRLITCVPFFIIYLIIIKKKGIFTIDIQQIKEALRFSLPLLPGAISYLVISMLDRIILERYVSLSSLGIYSVAATLSLTLNIVIQGLYRSFEQKIYREHNSIDYLDKVNKLYKIYIAALYVPAFCVILFSKEILFFFASKQYFTAADYVSYLVIAVIVSGMNTFVGTLLIADNKRNIISYSSFTAAILSFIINLVFIKYYGVIGACFASILSFLIVSIFYFIKITMHKKYLFQQVCFIAIFILSTYFIHTDVSVVTTILIKFLMVIVFALIVKQTLGLKINSIASLNVLKDIKQV